MFHANFSEREREKGDETRERVDSNPIMFAFADEKTENYSNNIII